MMKTYLLISEKLEKQITEIYEFITNFIQGFEEKY